MKKSFRVDYKISFIKNNDVWLTSKLESLNIGPQDNELIPIGNMQNSWVVKLVIYIIINHNNKNIQTIISGHSLLLCSHPPRGQYYKKNKIRNN